MNQKNELEYPLDKVKEVVRKWLYLENDQIIDVLFGTIIANQFETDPLWLMNIAPPSSTKTELLRGYEGHEKTYFLSNLTPATLVSGVIPKKGQPDPSLLPLLNNKILILKDFTTILTMRSENQQEILSQLREIYDGQYSKVFGNGKRVSWRGRVGLIAACTPAFDKHYAVLSSLGERFVIYRNHTEDQNEMGIRAQKIVGHEQIMRDEIRQGFHRFLDQFKDLDDIEFGRDETVNQMIISLACFCAAGRCPVERNRYDQTLEYIPLPEGSPRLVKQFMQLGMGVALAQGKRIIDGEVYAIVRKIGRDLLPAKRLIILERLWRQRMFEHCDGWKKTREIADAVEMPTSTARVVLEDLQVVGLLNRKVLDEDALESGKAVPYEWQINRRCFEYMSSARLFDDVKEDCESDFLPSGSGDEFQDVFDGFQQCSTG